MGRLTGISFSVKPAQGNRAGLPLQKTNSAAAPAEAWVALKVLSRYEGALRLACAINRDMASTFVPDLYKSPHIGTFEPWGEIAVRIVAGQPILSPFSLVQEF